MYPGVSTPPASLHILPEQQSGKFDRNRNHRVFPAPEQGDSDAGATSLFQARVRQEVLAGLDVLSVSKTPAEERTQAYLKPCYELLEDIHQGKSSGGLSVLVLVPTSEAATQVRQEAERLGEAGDYRAASLTFNKEQLEAISSATILIATPCRLKDLLNSVQVDLSNIFYLVLDGADKMVQMGLEPQVRDIIKRIPSQRQSLVFSESLGSVVRNLTEDIFSNPRSSHLEFEANSRASVIQQNPQFQTEVRAVKRSAGSPPSGQKPKMILSKSAQNSPSKTKSLFSSSPTPTVPVIIPIIPRAAVQRDESSAEDKEKFLAHFGLCSVSKAEEIR